MRRENGVRSIQVFIWAVAALFATPRAQAAVIGADTLGYPHVSQRDLNAGLIRMMEKFRLERRVQP